MVSHKVEKVITLIMLRKFQKQDAESLYVLSNHPYFKRQRLEPYLYADSLTHAQQLIDVYQHINPQRFLIYAIIKDGKLTGFIQGEVKTCLSCEISYWIGVPYWNHGIATEAIHLLCEDIKSSFAVKYIYARVLFDNEASKKVLIKNKFKQTQVYENIHIFERNLLPN